MNVLEKSIEEYLQWMLLNRYDKYTCSWRRQVLVRFAKFVNQNRISWDNVFTYDTFINFLCQAELRDASTALKGFSQYLFKHNRINRPIEKPAQPLPEMVEAYLEYSTYVKEVCHAQVLRTKKILCAFWDFLEANSIRLKYVRIEQVDEFLADNNRCYKKTVWGIQRSYLRGFLAWLYQNKVIKKNLAPMIVGAPVFSRSKPPKFLMPHEINTLFSSLTGQVPLTLRVAAMVYLGFYLGLRPIEISRIELDDIEFKKLEIRIPQRKNTNPIRLPLPVCCIKAITAYILGGRPKTLSRRLFITSIVPYRPVLPRTVCSDITKAMKRAGLKSSSYWLRHTYVQNLLEAGVSVFEIKEMVGHESIETTQRYLHVHTKLMREVLFDDDEL